MQINNTLLKMIICSILTKVVENDRIPHCASLYPVRQRETEQNTSSPKVIHHI